MSHRTDAESELAAYEALEELLDSLIPTFKWSGDINLRLERIGMLVDLLDHPELSFSSVHVGGTSGKGTVAAMTSAILSAHGYRVGLHVSPYVEVLTETWQIDGKYALPSRVLAVARKVVEVGAPIQHALPADFGPPSYFETKVATAFQLFREEKVDYGVIEVGLGGARDATNVLGAGVQVLTNVGLDHTDRLGETVEEIAADKVQIFKPGSRVISGVEQASVEAIARRQANLVGAHFYLLGEEVSIEFFNPGVLSLRFDERSIDLDVPADWPRFRQRNAALAVVAAQLSVPSPLDGATASLALASIRLPGRLERVDEQGRIVIIDGAHNVEKMRTTANYLQQAFSDRRCVGVIALKEDKDAQAILREVAPFLNSAVFTTFEAALWQSTSPHDLASMAKELTDIAHISANETPGDALDEALRLTDQGDVIVITGSLYLAGNLRRRWFPEANEILSGGTY